MNEHIGMLAEQAGLLGPTSRIGNSHEATERFARLIVKECMSCGDNLAKHYIDTQCNLTEQTFLLAAIADYTNEIKRRFGVV